MVPIYGRVFGVRKEELGDGRLMGRLRRCGVGGSSSVRSGNEAAAEEAGEGTPARNRGRKARSDPSPSCIYSAVISKIEENIIE